MKNQLFKKIHLPALLLSLLVYTTGYAQEQPEIKVNLSSSNILLGNNAGAIIAGTLDDNRLSSNVVLTHRLRDSIALVKAHAANAGNITSGTLSSSRLSSDVVLSQRLGDSIALVKLNAANAANITTGTLSDSRLSTNVALLNSQRLKDSINKKIADSLLLIRADLSNTINPFNNLDGYYLTGKAGMGKWKDTILNTLVHPREIIYDFLGSTIKAEPLWTPAEMTGAQSLASGTQRVIMLFCKKPETLSAVTYFLTTAGNFTAGTYNGFALYKVEKGVGTVEKVAETANDATIWTGTNNTWKTKSFVTPYVASPGAYYLVVHYSTNGTQTLAPAIASQALAASDLTRIDFTNGHILAGTASLGAAITSLPATLTPNTQFGASGAKNYAAVQ